MGGESGYVAVSTDGKSCPGSGNAYRIPTGSPAAYDGKLIWYADPASNGVNSFDPLSGEVLTSLPTGQFPSALVFDGTRMWVAHSGENTVRAFDTSTGSMGDRIPVGDHPSLLLFDGKRVWVANNGSRTVEWIDPAPYNIPVITPIPTQPRAPSATPTQTLPVTKTPLPSATPTTIALTRNLYLTSPHMTGEDVRQLQLCLAKLGYTEVGLPDGDFGSLTDQAVRRFQQEHDLVVDGIVGSITWAQLINLSD
jgi:DNA-binding beta-propeller fold protein YncE